MGLKETMASWFGTAKEVASDAAEKAKPQVEKAMQATKEAAADAAEKAKPHVDKAMQKAKDTASDLSDKAKPQVEKAKEKVSELAGQAKGADATDETAEAGESVGDDGTAAADSQDEETAG